MKTNRILAVLMLVTMLSPIVMTETVFAAHSEPPATDMHKTEDFFLGSFSPPEVTAVPNEPFDVSFSICPTIDAPDTIIRFIMPADLVTVVSGDAIWQGDLKKDEKLTLSLSMTTQGEIEAYVRVNVEASQSGKNRRNSYYLHVTVPMTEEATHKVRTVKSESLPTTRNPESPRVEIAPQAPAGPGPGQIEIKGSWWFVNDVGGWSPGRYMLVYLMDDDTLTDETVASQWTGANGEFDFIVDNDDGFLQGGRDPYLKFYAEGTWDWKTTDTNGNQYNWQTGVLGEDVPDGWIKDVGGIAPGSSNNALMAGDAIFVEMNWVYWNSGVNWDRSKVTVRWPREDWPHSHGDYIDLPATGWDHVTVYHEDGHCVMWTLYGNTWPEGWVGCSHWIGMEDPHMPCAWTEGWAEFMEAAVDNNPNNLAGNGQNVETNDWYNWVDTGDMDGAHIEGEVASILWDILDPVNIPGDDDHMNWGYDEIFTVLRYGDAGADDNPNSILEFWDDWASRWPANATSMGPLCDIYYNYGIDKDWYNPWGTIIINAGATYTTSRTVTLTLSADDWGVGVKYMRFSEDGGNTWGSWYYYSTTLSYYITKSGDGWKWIDVQFADFWWVSNGGTIYDGITLDTTNPTTTISHSAGSSTVSLSATDTTSGIKSTFYRIDAGSWVTYAGPFTLTGTGTHTIYYYSQDNALNNEATKQLVVHYLTVNTNPLAITTILGTGWYNQGSTAAPGTAPATVVYNSITYTFSTWKVDGTPVSGNPILVSMNAPHTATAFYSTSTPQPTITIWTDKNTYKKGETMKVYVRVKNPGNAISVRVTIRLQLPDGSYYGSWLDMTVTLPAGYDTGDLLWNQITLPAYAPLGNYKWIAELKNPTTGALISQNIWNWQIAS